MSIVDFISVNFKCEEPFKEILIAELDSLGYNSMMEINEGLEAYIETEKFIESDIQDLINRYADITSINYDFSKVITRNWNEEWEKNYDPILIEDKIYVRATFHEKNPSFQYEIIINPRMSFGTGHHATTCLMLNNMLDIDLSGKRVLDAGCGTGILAIMAEILNAREIIAYDNNSWSTENVPENIDLNHCKNITVMEGTINTLGLTGNFDIILANINKNVLLEETCEYQKYLTPGGILLLSGFYEQDDNDICAEAQKYNLKLVKNTSRSHWSSLVFEKI